MAYAPNRIDNAIGMNRQFMYQSDLGREATNETNEEMKHEIIIQSKPPLRN